MAELNDISLEEWLARYILYHSHLRHDGTVKQDAFIPYPWPDLSVTRHLQLTENELWDIGRDIASHREKTLLGRADLQVKNFQQHQLEVVAAPVAENSNHANVTGWPKDKPAQKIIAQQIALAAGKIRKMPI